MNVQIVHDEVPAERSGVGGDRALQVGEEVGLGAGRAGRGGDYLTGRDVAVEDERECPVPEVLELPPLNGSTWPGASGRPGCFRSSACTPGNSSVLTTRSPRSATSGASW